MLGWTLSYRESNRCLVLFNLEKEMRFDSNPTVWFDTELLLEIWDSLKSQWPTIHTLEIDSHHQ